jgi:RHS repeat-associated protein
VPNNYWVKSRTQIDAANWAESITYFDGLGRAYKSEEVDAQGNIFTEKEFDAQGRVKRVTNPFRATEAKIWTTNVYDEAGRVKEVVTADNAKVTTAYGVAVTGGQIGTIVTVTDQAGKQRRSITNALGQLTRVDEPNDAGSLGTIDNPAQPTNYAYDTLSNLTTVSQGVQTRTFAYDSLARLKQANNPESGIINYNYDNNGNLTSKIDARNITTSYAYDALNRVKTRTYTGETGYATPNVIYFYDNLPNAKGRLTKVVTGSLSAPLAETRYTAFDNLGRVTGSQQVTEGTAYNPQSYVYNLSGALIEETYPSGRVVKNTLDNDGDLSQVQSRKANDSFRNYANSFTYTSAGAVSSLKLGNGRWENTQFNSRLQPTQIGLGASAASQNSLKLNFDYGTTDNNGNVKSQTITVPTVGATAGFTAIQTYTYDSLNRIKDAKEMIGTTQQWKQTFLYDRYGNRRFDTANNNTTTLTANCPTAVCNPTIDPATNKLIGYQFDNSGNTKQNAENQKFTYDAENKQVKVETVDANGNPIATIGQYFYDGDGKRIKKISATETTIFVYNASGQLVAEYSTQIAQVTDAKVSYLTNDHLGSPRITTDQNGQVISRRDFQPFGEEIARVGYGSDSVRQKFTGYEKDEETKLNFAQARYQNAGYGRFTSPDPLMASARRANPQTFNRYTYVTNNPLNLIDPLGLMECPPGATCDENDEEIIYIQSIPGCNVDNTCSNITPPAASFVGPVTPPTVPPVSPPTIAPPSVPPAVLAPGAARVFFSNAARSVLFSSMVGPAIVIGALAGTVQAPVPMRQPTTTTTTTDDEDVDRDTLYRGVTVGHPGYDEALIGTARPRGGTSDAEDHNEGFTDSIYTSWSTSFSTASWYANRSGQGGVVLTSRIPRSRQIPSIDRFNEGEVLVRGVVSGATVTMIKPR